MFHTKSQPIRSRPPQWLRGECQGTLRNSCYATLQGIHEQKLTSVKFWTLIVSSGVYTAFHTLIAPCQYWKCLANNWGQCPLWRWLGSWLLQTWCASRIHELLFNLSWLAKSQLLTIFTPKGTMLRRKTMPAAQILWLLRAYIRSPENTKSNVRTKRGVS